MIMIAANNIAKTYGAEQILTDVSLEIHDKSRVGFVGPNGAGKSTLFRLLCDLEEADSGQIFRAKGATFAYLPQRPQFPAEWTGFQVIQSAFASSIELGSIMRKMEDQMKDEQFFTSMQENEQQIFLEKYQGIQEQFERAGGYDNETTISKVKQGLGIDSNLLETPFNQLSGGEQTRIGLAKLLCQQSDVLLLDEPTNHLDLDAMEWLEEFVRQYKGTVLIISHDRYFLDAVVTSIYEVDNGEIEHYLGTYSNYVKEKEERLLRQFSEYQEQQRKIKKMKETIKRLKEWGNRSNPPNEGFHRRAKSMEKALARIEIIERPKMEADRMGLVFKHASRSGQEVVRVEQLHKQVDQKALFENADMSIRYGERKALLGPNGCGKSTLLKMIMGTQTPDKGSVKTGSQVTVGFLSQQGLDGDAAKDIISLFRETVTVTEGEARHMLAKFLFYGHQVFKKVDQLSGGERMRLRLAQLMHQNHNLLVLDEPTNHLDIEAREALEEAISHYQGTLLLVSHDRYFLQKLVQGIYWVENKKLVHDEGTYAESREKHKERLLNLLNSNQQQDRIEVAPISNQSGKKAEKPTVETISTKPQKKINPWKLAKLESDIAELENEREECLTVMNKAGNHVDQIVELQAKITRIEEKLEEQYAEWYVIQEEK
ncbi:ribosomal protection-like ABC-F family protein [Brevibacillus daliensis]|uniref:ribosomal protection-like ABC-F family protein n=1 Tax=Brevibacillus daliensis TaxID=2892995 RepID=UPI001E588A3B|nr:ABC-F type ribosomal protection protein [Brevibacillus daliensis]